MAPAVYVRHEIVHNRYVVDSLRAKGAIFVEELARSPTIPNRAGGVFGPWRSQVGAGGCTGRNFFSSTPLSAGHQVHRERRSISARPRNPADRHSHHPEVVGTLGQLPAGAVTLIETAGDAASSRRRIPTISPRHADDTVDRRHRRNRRDAKERFRTSRVRTRKTLLYATPTASSR